MSNQIIFYNIDKDKIITLPVVWNKDKVSVQEIERLSELDLVATPMTEIIKLITPNTFTLSFSDYHTPISMTYNEWETLRSNQANQQIQVKINELSIRDEDKEKLKHTFAALTEGMRIKYLGQKSWTSIYEDLFENLNNFI